MSVAQGLGWPTTPRMSPQPVGWQDDVSRETKDVAGWVRTVEDKAAWDRDGSE